MPSIFHECLRVVVRKFPVSFIVFLVFYHVLLVRIGFFLLWDHSMLFKQMFD